MTSAAASARLGMAEIVEALEDVPEDLREIAFKEILRAHLANGHGSSSPGTRLGEQSDDSAPAHNGNAHPAFSTWANENGVADGLTHLMDFEDGTILTTRLGKSTAEQTRTVGAFLALHAASKTGEFACDKEAHRQACDALGAYDRKNHSANMGKFSQKGRRIFLDKGTKWQLTPDGKDWAGNLIQNLLGSDQA